MLHIVGTYEKAEEEEGEVYEVVNIKTLKQATPNLRIINLYGITFLDDIHIEAFSSNCIQLQVGMYIAGGSYIFRYKIIPRIRYISFTS